MTTDFLHGIEVVSDDSGARPIQVARKSIIGLVGTAPNADPDVYPLLTPVLVAASQRKAAKLTAIVGNGASPDAGTLPQAMDDIFNQIGAVVIVVRVAPGATAAETMANVIAGCQKFLLARSILGYKPGILIAPGFTHQRVADPANEGQTLRNPVVSALMPIADRLGAVAITDAENYESAILMPDDFGSKRIYAHCGFDITTNRAGALVTVPASARIAGQIARRDKEKGWWWSPSNQEVNAILGTSPPIDGEIYDPNSLANLLNGANVATTIHLNGYRLWGNRTLSADPKWKFLSVVRTADVLNESLIDAHLWAVDQPMSSSVYFESVTDSVNNFMRALTREGALVGGSCWADPDDNSPDQLADGHPRFRFDFTAPAPAERITFYSSMVDKYYAEIF